MRDAETIAGIMGDTDAFVRACARARGVMAGAFLALGLAAAGPAAAAELRPLEPQPEAADLEAGLSVDYYQAYFREIEDFEYWMEDNEGKAGKPLPALNYRTAGRAALTSGIADGVGAKIDGLIHLAKTGTYAFTVQSNDGFVLDIGGVPLLEDTDVHGDRYSAIAKPAVAQPGWYRLSVLYFERKGTSTLELYWRPPGEEDAGMVIVPAAAFAHLKTE